MIIEKKGDLFIGRFPRLFNHTSILHGISTRLGGISPQPYSSLNLGNATDDMTEHIASNRNKFFHELGINESRVAFPVQTHSSHIQIIDKPGKYEDTDALITNQKNLFLSILIADCQPVLLIDMNTSTIAAIHAGWRGCASNIVSKTAQLMFEHFNTQPANLQAFVGPSIAQCCYEVGDDVTQYFSSANIKNSHLNLFTSVKEELSQLDVPMSNVLQSGICTSCNNEYFYSHRKDEGVTGRNMVVIGIFEN